MGKIYSECKLCGSKAFLNYADLCKRCNRKPESSKIKNVAFEKQQVHMHDVEVELEKQHEKELEDAAKEKENPPEGGEETTEAKPEGDKKNSEEKAK